MAVNAPIVNPSANFTPLVAPTGGLADPEKGQRMIAEGKDLFDKLALENTIKDIGQNALAGEQKALQEIALMPQGAEVASTLQTIAATNNEQVIKIAQREMEARGKFAGSLLNEPEKFQRGSLMRRAFELKNDGKIKEGNEMMRIAQLPADEMKSELQLAMNMATPAAEFFKNRAGAMTDIKKIREELRGKLDKQLTGITAKVEGIETNYQKIVNLSDQIDLGNRTAVAQGLVALVKLGDPTSAVLTAEMEAALNKQDPWGAMTDLLLSKGVKEDVVNAVVQKMDPLNPANVKTSDLLATAGALVKSQVPALEKSYGAAEENSLLLSDEGKLSVFGQGLDKRIGSLNGLIAPSGGEAGGNQPAAVENQPIETTFEAITINGKPLTSFRSVQEITPEMLGEMTKDQQVKVLQYFQGGGQ